MIPSVSDWRLSYLYFFRELKKYLNYLLQMKRTLIINYGTLNTSLFLSKLQEASVIIASPWQLYDVQKLSSSTFWFIPFSLAPWLTYGFPWVLKLFPIRAESACPRRLYIFQKQNMCLPSLLSLPVHTPFT